MKKQPSSNNAKVFKRFGLISVYSAKQAKLYLTNSTLYDNSVE